MYAYHTDGTTPAIEDGWVFVFGSNLAGRHGAGAALEAVENWGAQYGTGIGLRGYSYAIPTKDERLKTLPYSIVMDHICRFIKFAESYQTEAFWVTRIGCGLAGYKDVDIAPLFRGAPTNCNFPMEWARYLNP